MVKTFLEAGENGSELLQATDYRAKQDSSKYFSYCLNLHVILVEKDIDRFVEI